MTDGNLRKMNRKELLELLIEMEKENSELRELAERQQAELEDRTLRIESAGSMAEAAMMLSGIFEDADRAARQYLENIRGRSEALDGAQGEVLAGANEEARRITEEAEEGARKITAAAEEEARAIIAEAQEEARRLIGEAEAEKQQIVKETDEYWKTFKSEVGRYYQEHSDLQGLFANKVVKEFGEE